MNFRRITIPVHVLGIIALVLAPAFGSWHYLLFFPIFWFLVSGLGIAIGYHRLLSHRAFNTHPWVARGLALLGIFAGQGSPVFWVATHRGGHHPHSDTDADPHSPRKGLWHAFLGWQMYFSEQDFRIRDAIDVMKDPWLRGMSGRYYQIYWSGLLGIAIFDWKLFLFGVIPMCVYSIHQENVVNVLCHSEFFGYRNFETKDHSRNSVVLGFLFWGQALHNNHHRFPKDYDFGKNWYEIDLCRFIVPLLKTREAQPQLQPQIQSQVRVRQVTS